MKSLLGLVLVALVVAWLVWPRGGVERENDEVVESSRRVRGVGSKNVSRGAATVNDLESYVTGLSDEELWEELDGAYERWMAGERSDWDGKRQPRLAIMLAREIGKRNGESGMKRVAIWLKGRDDKLSETGNYDLGMEFQFLKVRIQVASYAGWVSDNPETAISRLIESRREEEDWPVVNLGFMMYLKIPEFFAIEEVLREGFRDLKTRDFEMARRLFVEGAGVWAFDANEVAESFLADLPKEEWSDFISDFSDEVRGYHVELLGDEVGDSGMTRFRKENWILDYRDFLSKNTKTTQHGNSHLLTFSRSRPDETALALRDHKISQEKKKWLFLGMALTDSQHYAQLKNLDDERKIEVVGNLSRGTYELVFGPLTGKEHLGEFDRDYLISVIGETSMSDKTRELLRELILK